MDISPVVLLEWVYIYLFLLAFVYRDTIPDFSITSLYSRSLM